MKNKPEVELATKGSLMNENDFYKDEIKRLKNLLEQVYETSFIDDMISDLKKADLKKDEDQLIHLLILRQDIERALNLSMTKESVSKIEEATGVTVDRTLKHNGSSDLSKHYKEE